MGLVLIGTSGYNYDDWKGNFYPKYLDKKDYLKYYSGIFKTVEINFTYYSFPNPYIFKNFLKKTENNFIFSVKAHSSFTHNRDFKEEDCTKFFDSLKPIYDTKKMGPILFQFPWSFKFGNENMDYIKKIGDIFSGRLVCMEFRNAGWINDKTFGCLEQYDISFCNVDEPLLKGLIPPTDINTNNTGYIRFHGRNKSSWWNHKFAYQRYDYLYSDSELLEWVPKIKKISSNTKKTFIYFNNHYKAKAVNSAKLLINLLAGKDIITSQN